MPSLDARMLALLRMPAAQAYLGACLMASAYSLYLFPIDFIAGTGVHWESPHGDLVTPNGADRMHNLIGMRYFLADDWHYPIFKTALIAPNRGAIIIYSDSIPVLALAAKLIEPLGVEAGNSYGFWIVLCVLLQAVGAVYLVRSLGVDTLFAGLCAAALALCFPAFLFRFGHSSLFSQFVLLFALGHYFRSIRRDDFARQWKSLALLASLSLFIQAYLFLPVFGVFVAAAVQHAQKDKRHLHQSISIVAAVTVAEILLIAVSGYLTPAAQPDNYGHNTMNLLSPFVPQLSGLFPWMSGFVDATGGQFDGYNYLGAGALLLLIAGSFVERHELVAVLRRYWALAALFVCIAIVAGGNEGFAGSWKLYDIPWVPDFVQQLRASGRFFWIVGYAALAFGVVVVARKVPPKLKYVLLAAAVVLQAIDVAPLVGSMRASARTGATLEIPRTPWEGLIAGHDKLTIYPIHACSGAYYLLLVELAFHASRSVTPINTTYLDRLPPGVDCVAETEKLGKAALGSNELLVVLSPPISDSIVRALPGFRASCRKFDYGFACSRRWRDFTGRDVESYFAPPEHE